MHLAVPLYMEAGICPLTSAVIKLRQIHHDISHSVSLFAARDYAMEASSRFILSFRSIRSRTSPSWFSEIRGDARRCAAVRSESMLRHIQTDRRTWPNTCSLILKHRLSLRHYSTTVCGPTLAWPCFSNLPQNGQKKKKRKLRHQEI